MTRRRKTITVKCCVCKQRVDIWHDAMSGGWRYPPHTSQLGERCQNGDTRYEQGSDGITDEQIKCEHTWSKRLRNCKKCLVTRKQWAEYLVTFDPPRPDVKDIPWPLSFAQHESTVIRTPVNPIRRMWIGETEQTLGMPSWYKGYNPEAYLVPDKKFESNGTA